MQTLFRFIDNVVDSIINPLIGLLFALALLYFVWGASQFVLNAGNEDGRKKGKEAMMYGLIGLFLMSAVLGILAVVTSTFDVQLPY